MSEPLYGTPSPHQPPLGPLSPLLDRSSTSAQPDAETLRALGVAEKSGDFYQRLGSRNGRAFEALVASNLEVDGETSPSSVLRDPYPISSVGAEAEAPPLRHQSRYHILRAAGAHISSGQ